MQIKAYSKVTPLLKIYKKKQNDTKHRIMGIFGINKTIYDLVKISQSRKNKDEINYFANKKKIRISNCRVRVALSYLRKHFKIPFYKCQIYKQIPLSSGLGGSATDAASVIKFVLNKNNISLKQLDLKQIAFEIGSDVPFFILGKEWAKVTNYGDKITPIQKHKYNWKIILTNIPNSTKQTFKKLDHDQKYKSKAKERLCNISPKNNDLQPYAFAINKKLKAKYEELQQKFTIVMLLGSGGSFLVQKPKTKLSD